MCVSGDPENSSIEIPQLLNLLNKIIAQLSQGCQVLEHFLNRFLNVFLNLNKYWQMEILLTLLQFIHC